MSKSRKERWAPVKDVPDWERHALDTDMAWQAFTLYRDLGLGRVIAHAALLVYYPDEASRPERATDVQLRQCYEWSRLNAWKERAASFDINVDELAALEMVKKRADMFDRHTLVGKSLVVKGGQRLQQIPTETLTFDQALKAIELGGKLERQVLGDGDKIDLRIGESSGPDGAEMAAMAAELLAKPEARQALQDKFDEHFLGQTVGESDEDEG